MNKVEKAQQEMREYYQETVSTYKFFVEDRLYMRAGEIANTCWNLLQACLPTIGGREINQWCRDLDMDGFIEGLMNEIDGGMPETLAKAYPLNKTYGGRSKHLDQAISDWSNLSDNTWDTIKGGNFAQQLAQDITDYCKNWTESLDIDNPWSLEAEKTESETTIFNIIYLVVEKMIERHE